MKFIVTTTINPPTKALLKYASIPGWHVIVAGDLKTKHEQFSDLENITYLSPQDQESQHQELSDLIGWNCMERKNMAILEAYSRGAEYIALIDDDNIPYDDWGNDLCVGKKTLVNYYMKTGENDIAFDPIGACEEYKHLWHRGFPLELLPHRSYKNKCLENIIPDLQAIMWDGDPDVDAICRMIHKPQCKFDPRYFPMASDRFSPCNGQNIILSRKVISDYFLFPQTERMQDIWASYYIQSRGFKVVYTKSGVFSDRSLGTIGRYSVINDMKKEYLGMEYNKRMLEDLKSNSESIHTYLPERASKAFSVWKQVINSL
jgi:hypothetical protein